MKITFTGSHVKWRSKTTKPTSRPPGPPRAKSTGENQGPVAATIRRKQNFKTGVAATLQTLKVPPKAFVTFTIDKSIREQLSIKEQLALLARIKKTLKRMFPKSKGSSFIWVLGYSWHAGLHMHVMATFGVGGKEKILTMLRHAWGDITGSYEENLVHGTAYKPETHLGYLVSRKKDDEILLLLEKVGRARAYGVLNSSNLKRYAAREYDLSAVKRADALAVLTRWVKAKKLPESTLAQFKKSKGSLAFLPEKAADKLLKIVCRDENKDEE